MADKTGIQVEGLAKHSDVDPSTATQTQAGPTLGDQPGLQAPSPVFIECTRIPTAVGRDKLELREYRHGHNMDPHNPWTRRLQGLRQAPKQGGAGDGG